MNNIGVYMYYTHTKILRGKEAINLGEGDMEGIEKRVLGRG